jgi:hypothetical protein
LQVVVFGRFEDVHGHAFSDFVLVVIGVEEVKENLSGPKLALV